MRKRLWTPEVQQSRVLERGDGSLLSNAKVGNEVGSELYPLEMATEKILLTRGRFFFSKVKEKVRLL